jgi:hypothetical protein
VRAGVGACTCCAAGWGWGLEWKKKPLPKKFRRLAYPGMNPFCAVCDALACAHNNSAGSTG